MARLKPTVVSAAEFFKGSKLNHLKPPGFRTAAPEWQAVFPVCGCQRLRLNP